MVSGEWYHHRLPQRHLPPHESVERAAVAAYFYRLAGSPAVTLPQESPFIDVPTDHPFYKEIVWLHRRGITTGYPDGTFRPNAPINRDALAAFFYRAAQEPDLYAIGSLTFCRHGST